MVSKFKKVLGLARFVHYPCSPFKEMILLDH